MGCLSGPASWAENIAASPNTASETIRLNTYSNSGDFYIRVRGRNGLFYWSGTGLAKLVLEGDASPAFKEILQQFTNMDFFTGQDIGVGPPMQQAVERAMAR